MDRRQRAVYSRYIIVSVCHIILPIAIGAMLYVLFRPDTHISHLVYDLLRITAPQFVKDIPPWLTLICRNFIPDMLWAYALTAVLLFILNDNGKYSLFICIFFEIFLEVCQKWGIVTGTFDMLDILLEVCTTAFAALIITFDKGSKL